MADHRFALKVELQELLLVALGAVPGALMRWQLSLHLADQNLVANTHTITLTPLASLLQHTL